MPHCSCTILRTLRPLKTSAVGWKVCTSPLSRSFKTAWLSRVLTTACRAKKELFTGPHHLHRRCQIRFNPPTAGHVCPRPAVTPQVVPSSKTTNATASPYPFHVFVHSSPLHFLYQHDLSQSLQFQIESSRFQVPHRSAIALPKFGPEKV